MVTRFDDNTYLFDSGSDDFLDDQLKRRLVVSVAVNQLLERRVLTKRRTVDRLNALGRVETKRGDKNRTGGYIGRQLT